MKTRKYLALKLKIKRRLIVRQKIPQSAAPTFLLIGSVSEFLLQRDPLHAAKPRIRGNSVIQLCAQRHYASAYAKAALLIVLRKARQTVAAS